MTDCKCRADAYEYATVYTEFAGFFPVKTVNDLAKDGFRVVSYATSTEFGTRIILERPLEA